MHDKIFPRNNPYICTNDNENIPKMKTMRWSGWMTAIVVPLVWSCSDRHVREIPLEEFFRNSEVRSYDISPVLRLSRYGSNICGSRWFVLTIISESISSSGSMICVLTPGIAV